MLIPKYGSKVICLTDDWYGSKGELATVIGREQDSLIIIMEQTGVEATVNVDEVQPWLPQNKYGIA